MDRALTSWLEEDDRRTRPHRVERLRLLRDESDPEGLRLFHGGTASAGAFEEARLAYLHGLFMSCIVMVQVCVEHMLQGLFYGAGRDDLTQVSYARLLKEARRQRLLSAEEFELFERLRQLRNPYVHYRPPGGPSSGLARALELNASFEDLLAEDARLAVAALLRLCRREPFALSVE